MRICVLGKLSGSARDVPHFGSRSPVVRWLVRFHEVVIESGHVEVAARAPFVGGDVSNARADEHQGAVALITCIISVQIISNEHFMGRQAVYTLSAAGCG